MLNELFNMPRGCLGGLSGVCSNRNGLNLVGHRREGFVLKVREMAPVVPPHERRIEDRKQPGIVDWQEECLVVTEPTISV